MGNVDLEEIIAAAGEAIADRPVMVSDGNPQEELARALERHADRIEVAARGIQDVGTSNHLGPVSEGEAATFNIRLGVYEHDRSLYRSWRDQAVEARLRAAAIRAIGRAILSAEGASAEAIDRVIRQ